VGFFLQHSGGFQSLVRFQKEGAKLLVGPFMSSAINLGLSFIGGFYCKRASFLVSELEPAFIVSSFCAV
jgi:hypothetical protein